MRQMIFGWNRAKRMQEEIARLQQENESLRYINMTQAERIGDIHRKNVELWERVKYLIAECEEIGITLDDELVH